MSPAGFCGGGRPVVVLSPPDCIGDVSAVCCVDHRRRVVLALAAGRTSRPRASSRHITCRRRQR